MQENNEKFLQMHDTNSSQKMEEAREEGYYGFLIRSSKLKMQSWKVVLG
jgi:hypothetical protein